jgi:hypothetical protein
MVLDLKFEILKKFRTQYDFALAVDEHYSKVSMVVRGRRKLEKDGAEKWAEILDCDPAILEPVTK